MTKQISITLADWVVESYLQNIPNRSQIIQKAIILMSEIEEGNIEETKRRNIELNELLRLKQEELNKCLSEIGKLKTINEDQKIKIHDLKLKKSKMKEDDEDKQYTLDKFDKKTQNFILEHIEKSGREHDNYLFRSLKKDDEDLNELDFSDLIDKLRKTNKDE